MQEAHFYSFAKFLSGVTIEMMYARTIPDLRNICTGFSFTYWRLYYTEEIIEGGVVCTDKIVTEVWRLERTYKQNLSTNKL